MNSSVSVSDSNISHLIEEGESFIRQEEAQRLAKQQAQEAELRSAWDAINENLRARLPVEVQPYMLPVYDSYPPHDCTCYNVTLEILGLAPVQALICTREEHIVYLVAKYYEFDSFDDDPLPRIQFYYPPSSNAIASLPVAMAQARKTYIEAHEKLYAHTQAHDEPDPVYAPVEDDPVLKPPADLLYNLVRDIVYRVIAERD